MNIINKKMIEVLMNVINKIKMLLKYIFITRPMLLPFILSIILDLITIFILLNFYKQSISFLCENIWFIVIIIICFILIFMYYYFFGKIRKEEFKKSSINSYIKVSKKRFLNYIWGSFLTLFKLIPQGVVLIYLIKEDLIKYIKEDLLTLFTIILWIVILYVVTNNVLFLLIPIPPIITFIILLTPIILFSLIGINNGIINWVFISIVLVTCINGLIDTDIKIVSFSDRIKNHLDNEFSSDFKDKVRKLKYEFLISIPFVYIGLYVSELIQEQLSCYYYKNPILFIVSISLMKMVILLCIIIIYIELKNIILDNIFRIIFKFTINKVLKNDGIYINAYVENGKWSLSHNNYFYVKGNEFQHINININTKYILEDNKLKYVKKVECYKKIKFVTDDILRVGSKYYINSCSETLKEINGLDTFKGDKLLKKVDKKSIALMAFMLLTTIIAIYMVLRTL